MTETKITLHLNLTAILVWSVWALGAAMVAAGVCLEMLTASIFGLAVLMVAMTLTVRRYCIELNQGMRAAFELGRESAVVGSVRDLRP